MNENKNTFRFLGVVTILLGLNLLILGKAVAQFQVASLEIQPGNLTMAVPRSVAFEKLIVKKNEPAVGNMFLNPFNDLETIQVIDPSTGETFHVNLTLQNMSVPQSATIQEDPAQDVPPFIALGQPVTVNVHDAKKYFANDTIVVNQAFNGGNEHMRVLSVDAQNNLIIVNRGVDNTQMYASPLDPVPQGSGLTPQHIVPFSQFKVITLHGNNLGQSVDTSTMNNPLGTNNVTSPISYYYHPGYSTAADYGDQIFTEFPADGTPGADPTAVNAASLPVTLMERTVDTPSVGVYSVGMLLRASIPADNPAGNYAGELTFSLEP